MRISPAFWVPATFLLVLSGCGRKYADAPPLSPQESLKSYRASEDFHLELFAAEPMVVSPVEIAFDENGRAYVAEMIDYPEDPPPGKPARSRIRLLEDTDGDGKADRSTIFAEQVLEVSGLLPWKGGLIVTSAPDILYMKDTNGDGRADERRVLYTGFPKVNPEGRITNLRLGIDNWIYAANNGADGKITSPEHPDRPPVLVRGADFRFHPMRELAEPASGPTQFGMTFDDWGNRFLSQNTVHIRHAVLPMQYLRRAPLLEVHAVSQDISDHGRPNVRMFPLTRPQSWRRQRTRLRQQRYDEHKLNRTEQVGGYFTAATGGTVYTGDAFPPEYRGNVFTADVSGNLVHRDILTPDGVTFSARRAKEGIEFLASTDVWTRPCNFANAPDGLLYMTDIYREFIETPESIPEEIKKNMDFWSGADMGRIFRIVPNRPVRKGSLRVSLGAMSAAGLVKQLANPNGWHRQTAQRLLVERQDRTAVPLLQEMARRDALPQARLHALWTLEGISALDPALVVAALKDPDAHVREHAVRLAEEFPSKTIADAVLSLASDPAPRVQFQMALTLGQFRDARTLPALAALARRHAADQWFRTAALSSAAASPLEFFEMVRDEQFLAPVGSLIGARRQPAEIARFLRDLARTKQPQPGLVALIRGLNMSGAARVNVPKAEAAVRPLLEKSPELGWQIARVIELPELIRRAGGEAFDGGESLSRRANAIRTLRGGQYATEGPVLRKVLDSHPPAELQAAAVESLAAFDDPGVSELLISRWRSFSPEARRKTLNALLNHRNRIPALLQALENGRIEISAVDVEARSRLIADPDPANAARARKLLAGDSTDRAKVTQSYMDALKLKGDVIRGKAAFDENCARCHMPRKQGGRVGPDLSGINNKTKEELLTSILNPSYAIEARYVNYVVTTRDGRMYDGVIANETPGAITLRGGSEEGDQTILRQNIAEIRASSVSLMPEGLEQSMSKQDIADVIAYLRGGL